MFRPVLLSFALAFALVRANDVSTQQVVAAFNADNVTKALGIKFDPSLVIQVQFPLGNNTFFNVTAGANVPRNVTAAAPLINVLTPTADPSDFQEGDQPVIVPTSQVLDAGNFVVTVVDLDAPTPQHPNASEIRHFLGSNFTIFPAQNPDALALLSNYTPAISDWLQPTPPAGSAAHRYVFLVFTQSPSFNKQKLVTPQTSRQNFSIAKFASATGLGSPLGGTFILVAPDASA